MYMYRYMKLLDFETTHMYSPPSFLCEYTTLYVQSNYTGGTKYIKLDFQLTHQRSKVCSMASEECSSLPWQSQSLST